MREAAPPFCQLNLASFAIQPSLLEGLRRVTDEVRHVLFHPREAGCSCRVIGEASESPPEQHVGEVLIGGVPIIVKSDRVLLPGLARGGVAKIGPFVGPAAGVAPPGMLPPPIAPTGPGNGVFLPH